MATVPLRGLRVVEIAGDPAGELTGLQLARMGAEVIKVEPPEGSPSRHIGPFAGGRADPERSLAYWYYNGNKQSVVLDTETAAGRAALGRLLASTDILVTTLSTGELERLAIELRRLADDHGVIGISLTPFGLTGEWANYRSSDLVGLATGGLLITSGYDDHTIPPIRPGGDQAFHTAASFGYLGALLGLIDRQITGRGAVIDVSMQDSCAVTCELANPYWFYPKALVQRQTCRHAQPTPTQPALFECADGYVYFALVLADTKPWQVLVEWLDRHGLVADLADPAYADVAYRQSRFPHIQGVLEAFFMLQKAHDAYMEGQRRGVPIGVLNAPEDLFSDEHLRARGFFEPIAHPGFGEVLHPGVPARFSSLEPVPQTAAPALGEHTEAVLTPLGSA